MTLLVVGLATWFVFSEDGYVANGSTKWETRGSSAHDLYIAAIVIATFLFLSSCSPSVRTKPCARG